MTLQIKNPALFNKLFNTPEGRRKLEELIPRKETYRREAPKIGRNDPCPCESGKKFKKCCLGKPNHEPG